MQVGRCIRSEVSGTHWQGCQPLGSSIGLFGKGHHWAWNPPRKKGPDDIWYTSIDFLRHGVFPPVCLMLSAKREQNLSPPTSLLIRSDYYPPKVHTCTGFRNSKDAASIGNISQEFETATLKFKGCQDHDALYNRYSLHITIHRFLTPTPTLGLPVSHSQVLYYPQH